MNRTINQHSSKIFFLLTLFFCMGIFGFQLDQPEWPVKISANVSPQTARPDEVVTVNMMAEMDPKWHIYAIHKIADGPFPTNIKVEAEEFAETIGDVIEPEPITKFDDGFQINTHYHEGTVTFKIPVKVKSDIETGEYTINSTILYQACDPSICYPPKDETFDLQLIVESGEVRSKYSEFASGVITDGDNIDLNAAIARGFGSFVLLAISMGLLALLTPCVFPMIPITVSYFTKQGEQEGGQPLKQATVYSLGIVATYTILGLLLAVTLGASGANQLAANPWVNLFIGGLFVYFALSLFGMYEIQLPSALRQFSLKQEGRGGYVGTLFMALTFTLTSFTCTVQFVGLLLVAAVQGDWLWPIIGMLFFSAAFALPFFFLALFPQYLARMPKSGGWLNSVKVVMGFLELAAAFKFLSNTDLIWQWGFFTRNIVLAAWVVIVFLTGLYLMGKIRLSHDSELKTIGAPRLILCLFMFTFSIYMARGLVNQPIHGLIESYLPPVIKSGTGEVMSLDSHKSQLDWHLDFDEGLLLAQQTGKPVFLNFTGYTCTNCRWMESNVFTEPAVINRLDKYVLIELFTDGGENHEENQKMEIERFGTAALPFYVILNSENEEVARFPGLTRNLDRFIQFLDKGLTYGGSVVYTHPF